MIRRSLLLFLSFICFCFITSCKSDFKYSDLNKVTYEGILDLSHSSYIVVAYQAQCPNCDKLKDVISEYAKYAKKHNTAYPIYGINVTQAINKDIVIGKDDNYPKTMIGATSFEQIKVKATPAIFLITSGKVVKIISDYNTMRPVTDGKAFFEDLMK